MGLLLGILMNAVLAMAGRRLDVAMYAPWPSTCRHPIYEALEFVADELGAEKMWKAAALFSELDDETRRIFECVENVGGKYNLAIKTVLAVLEFVVPSVHILRMSLLTREYAARVEAGRMIAIASTSESHCHAHAILPGGICCEPQCLSSSKLLQEAISTGENDNYSSVLAHPTRLSASEPQRIEVQLIVNPASTEFLEWLRQSAPFARVLRPLLPEVSSANNTKLQGYGVNLDIKNLEYRNWDVEEKRSNEKRWSIMYTTYDFEDAFVVEGILFAVLAERKPFHSSGLSEFRTALIEESADSVSALKSWRVRDLGLQAAATVIQAPSAKLQTLRDLSQNFPSKALALSSREVPEAVRKHTETYYRHLAREVVPQPGFLYVGSRAFDLGRSTFSMHTVMKAVRIELRALNDIRSICSELSSSVKCRSILQGLRTSDLSARFGFTGRQGFEGSSVSEETQSRIDILTGSKGIVTYVNNVEKDEKYSHWPRSVRHLLQSSWRLQAISRNLYTVVLFLDAGDLNCLEAIETMRLMLDQGYPVRFGLVLLSLSSTDDETHPEKAKPIDGIQAALLFAALRTSRGPKTALDWLFRIAAESSKSGERPSLLYAVHEFARIVVVSSEQNYDDAFKTNIRTDNSKNARDDAWELLRPTSTSLSREILVQAVQAARIFAKSKGLCCNFFSYVLNGRVVLGLDLRNELLPMLLAEQARLSELVAVGAITDKTKSVYGKALLGRSGRAAIAPRFSLYLHTFQRSPDDFLPYYLNNLDTTFFSDRDRDGKAAPVLVAISTSCLESAEMNNTIVTPLLTSDNVAKVRLLLNNGEVPDRCYIVINGVRVDSEGMDEIDLRSIVAAEAQVARNILEALAPVLNGTFSGSEVIVASVRIFLGQWAQAVVSSEMDTSFQNPVLLVQQALGGPSPLIVIDEDKAEARCITAVLDPLSEAAQRGASVLLALRHVAKIAVSLILVPTPQLTQLPLISYYRFALDENYEDGQRGVVFRSLPRSKVFSLRVDTPASWDVQLAEVDQDLDNLRCIEDKERECRNQITYKLSSLVVGGQCFDIIDRKPPSGLQLELTDPLSPYWNVVSDTLVMQNLGYFQLRAPGPGIFQVRLAPNTPSARIYEFLNSSTKTFIAGDPYVAKLDSVPVVLADLDGQTTQVRVRKKMQFKRVDLVETLRLDSDYDDHFDDVNDSSDPVRYTKLLSRIFSPSNSLTLKKKFVMNISSQIQQQVQSSLEPIHVFSLATGALYERLLKIMMLSVRKRTTGPLHFWLYENYLTPEFKLTAAVLAKYRNMSVHYITYKWPEWLRQQTQKQRIIWGYKILFLDVLFPKDISKIIYVDADQVVRSDLRNLWNLNLKGRPYGYPPFCDTRPETHGFQFWRNGYWKDHLRGKPYHISALYVVDLHAFRRMAVGDQLRAVYDQLSRDTNSLANLDQDLPNYAQHSIPIFSLPEDWLWCESWCSDSSKKFAKTIDLCNNPLHKENKLDMAKRIINGSLFVESWTQLDKEIRAMESEALGR